VLVVGRNSERGEACVERIASADGSAEFVAADSTSRADLKAIVASLKAAGRGCDVLVNGAGINSATPFLEIDDDEWDSILNVNLRSVHTLGREQDLRFDESDVDRGDSLKGQRPVLFVDDEEPWMAAIHERQSLAPAARIEGPAIIEQPDTTTVVTRGWRAVVHTSRNLILEKASTREKLDRNGRL